ELRPPACPERRRVGRGIRAQCGRSAKAPRDGGRFQVGPQGATPRRTETWHGKPRWGTCSSGFSSTRFTTADSFRAICVRWARRFRRSMVHRRTIRGCRPHPRLNLSVTPGQTDIHTGASHALHTPRKALAPQPTPLARIGIRASALAVVAAGASIAVTRFTWPLFAGTPFIPLFAAVIVTTQWGTPAAGLVSIILTVLGAPFAFPFGAPSPWDPRTLIMFGVTTLVAN